MSAQEFNKEASGLRVLCPACGLSYPEGAKFCGQDGTVLPAPRLQTAPAGSNGPRQCAACKVIYPSYAQFCPVDGSVLASESAASGGAAEAAEELKTDSVSGTAAVLNESESTGKNEAPESVDADLTGKIIAGKYKIDGFLGEGGMAQVFRATHLGLGRPVVIKLMHGTIPSVGNATKRFELECKLTASLNHPNVVSVFDVGNLDGRRPYLVMEYIEGESLREYLMRETSMSIRDAALLMTQICSGLAEAHAKGIIHRDLKPENIMLRDDKNRPDWVKILDFGIANLKEGGEKLTQTGVAVGTVDYMSPEYLSDKPVDQRADIYALGVMLYEVIAGRCPFVADNPEALMAKHLWSIAQPLSNFRPELPAGCLFDELAAKALMKNPEERFQTVSDLRDAIKSAWFNFQKLSARGEAE